MGLRIALDASCAAKRERTGVARYATCLLDALARAGAGDQFTVGYRLSRFRRRRHAHRPAGDNVRVRWFTDALAKLLLGPFDLFHGLDARIPPDARFPRVATLHDVAPALAEGIASRGFRDKKQAAYCRLAAEADRIICVSKATRDQFQRLFDLPAARFAVIHHGIEPRFRPLAPDEVERALEPLRVRRPYLLFVGLLSARKNLVPLVAAFDKLARKIGNLRLVLAGGAAHGFEQVGAAVSRSPHRARIVLPGFVPDAALPALYAGAEAFVFPSRHEGFGIPMLEAMACGVPVVAADTAVAREVAGDAALLVDTDDPLALAEALLRLHGDPQARGDLVARGAARAAGRSWDDAARRTLAVYHEVLEGGRG